MSELTIVLLLLLAVVLYFAAAIFIARFSVPHTLPYRITTNWAAPPRGGQW